MNIDFIPFQIGEQYENWEFDLEPVILDLKKSYDKYRYFKNDITEILEVEVQDIFLYFSLDMLFRVEVVYTVSNPLKEYYKLVTKINSTFICPSETINSKDDKMEIILRNQEDNMQYKIELKKGAISLIISKVKN
jgi:hypothetical protein